MSLLWSLFVEERHECLADLELGDRPLHIELWIGAKRLRSCLHGLLVFWGESTQRVLHAIPELSEYRFRNIEWVLRDKVDTDAFRPHQPHHLRNLVSDHCGQVGEQQVRFVKKNTSLGLSGSPTSGSFSKRSVSSHSSSVA